MTLERITVENFTAFRALDVRFSPGINAFIGTNGTGKTHILKALYSACDTSKTNKNLAEKLVGTFMPHDGRLGRLAHRRRGSVETKLTVHRSDAKLGLRFSNHSAAPSDARTTGQRKWAETPSECAYIPVKEMLANAPGFRSLYAARQIHFEEIYADIVDRAYLPILRGAHDPTRKKLLRSLQTAIEGKVAVDGETFFLRNRQGKLEFSLLAEGTRKLALLWLLIQNGTLQGGSTLFWDEPEANLNPSVMRALVEILIALSRLGVQLFLATHDYILLKELGLQAADDDAIMFHGLHRDEDGVIQHGSSPSLGALDRNAIADTFTGLYDREVQRSFGG